MDNIIKTLCTRLQTASGREALVYSIDAVLAGNLQHKQEAAGKLVASLSGIGMGDLEVSDSNLQAVKSGLLSVPVVKIVLPYIPKQELLNRLYEAVSDATPTLLEISVDESLKGGFVVYKAGKIVDMSFKSKVEKLFKQDAFRAKILQHLQ